MCGIFVFWILLCARIRMTMWKEEIRRCEYAPSIFSSYRNCQATETSINRPMYGKIVAFVEPMSPKCLKIQ